MENEELNENLNSEEVQSVDAELGGLPGQGGETAEIELAKSGLSGQGGAALKDRKSLDEEEFFDEGDGQLTVDLYQTADDIILESPIAGVKPEDLDISITSESVTIKGSRQKDRRIKDEDYFYQECYWGKFSRSIILPQEVDAEKSEALIKNGVLTITLPKLNRQRSKKIRVQSE